MKTMARPVATSAHGVVKVLDIARCIYNNRAVNTLTASREIVKNCMAVRIRLIARAVSSLYDEAIASHKVTIAQLIMLAALGEIGPCAPRKLGEVLQLERSTVSRNLDLLMAKDLVKAVSSDAKGVREVTLSSKGQLKIEAALPDWRLAQKQVFDLLGTEGSQAIRDASASIWLAPV